MQSPCAQQPEYSLPRLLEVYQKPGLTNVSIYGHVQLVSALKRFTVFYSSNRVLLIPNYKTSAL